MPGVIIDHVTLLPYIKLLTLSNVRLFKPDELRFLNIVYRSCNQHSQFIHSKIRRKNWGSVGDFGLEFGGGIVLAWNNLHIQLEWDIHVCR